MRKGLVKCALKLPALYYSGQFIAIGADRSIAVENHAGEGELLVLATLSPGSGALPMNVAKPGSGSEG